MEEIRKLQLLELNEFKKLIKTLEHHKIKYYALGGTMLGAVRHNGFIPWDDDIDLGIPRSQYELFVHKISKDEKIDLKSYFNNKECKHYPARLYLDDVKVKKYDGVSFEPAWISIFPLDGLPNSTVVCILHKFRLSILRRLFRLARMDDVLPIKNPIRSKIKQIILNLLIFMRINKILDKDTTYHKIDKALKKYPYEKAHNVINFMGAYGFREIFPKSTFGDGAMYKFEDMMISGPVDFNYYLTHQYGNWKTPPDDIDPNKNHHNIEKIIIEG